MRACFGIVALLAAGPAAAHALEWDLILSNRALVRSIPEDVLYTELRIATATRTQARAAYQLHAAGFVEVRPVPVLGLRFGLDTGLIELSEDGAFADGAAIGDRARETLFLGETYADLQLGENGVLELRGGKLRARIGNGAIFDAYAFGVDADLDLGLLHLDPEDGNPFVFHANVLIPDATFTSERKTSPLLDFQIAYTFDRRSELRVFAAGFFDSEDGLAPVIADAVFRGRVYQAADAAVRGQTRGPASEVLAFARTLSAAYDAGLVGYEVHTAGQAFWTGVSGRVGIDRLRVSASVIGGFGEIDTDVRPDLGLQLAVRQIPDARRRLAAGVFLLAEGPETVSLRSLFADVRAELALSPKVTLDAFGLAMSGERGLVRETSAGNGTYGAFVSLAPLVPETQIFFNGGVAQSLASPVVASIAPDGAGLFAFGAGVEVLPWDPLRTRLNAAMMFSAVESLATGSRYEGFEVDLELDLEPLDFLIVSASGGVFVPGPYFGDLPAGYQLIVAAHVIGSQL